ncbi:hypothetical protein LTR53_016417 [Teratosphaeriaceae sp. CCFEE 6253]|nr:hypothetical protein LTR53_016417 [Teratosphaeriaceae sp. CCFEE 6253]
MLFKFLATLLACLAVFATADNDLASCAGKNQGVVNAIGRFCQKTDMTVPSWWAQRGMDSPDGRTQVHISGKCAPPQWVPQKYCFSQFWNMCAWGGHHGGSVRHYGTNNCQKWVINYG